MIPLPLRLGTRGSALALAQAAQVTAALAAAHAELAAPGAIETVAIRTTGDKIQDRPLYELGGKALFTKEIEEALLAGRIDVAVHSGKDMPTFLPPGLILAACLPREDPRDAFLSRRADSIAGLAAGAAVGTSSPRRTAQILHARPDLKIVPLRGNIDTRIRKLEAGEVDAAILALAGLKRLGLEARATAIIPVAEMLPAPAQGAIALEIRAEDERAASYLAAIDHAPTSLCIAAERVFLAVLGGDCRTPIAALARIDEATLQFRAAILKPDGSARLAAARDGAVGEAMALATDAGRDLLARAGLGFFG
ncbi:MAG TPA: hydroxymethylbilane synthase [Stellaceae bacterium]|nr:hydroxymethylbilane synthase [Stellaceae bacterium]